MSLDKWNEWHPFSGESPPDDYLLGVYQEELKLANGDAGKLVSGEQHPNPWYRQDFGGYEVLEKPLFSERKLRIVATGAGAAGIQLAYMLGQQVEGVDLTVYEKNDDVGGTWLVNTYPGCACDIPSHCYQFYWNRNPNWSSFYSPQAEIWQYLRDTVEKFGLSKFIKLKHEVLDCEWDVATAKWRCRIRGPDGKEFVDEADILINSGGPLSQVKWPNIGGLDDFQGKLMHTGAWKDDIELKGKTVAVLGSGSSAVQIVPNIQPIVHKLLNFVRSPVWLTPGFSARYAGPEGSNFAYTPEQKEKFVNDFKEHENYIRMIEEDLGNRFSMLHQNSEIQGQSRKVMEARMKKRIESEAVAEYLIPKFGLGCRRLSPGDEYMDAFNKDNVALIPSHVTKLTKDGLIDGAGKEHKVDVVICATGFDTSGTPSYPVKGRNGVGLKEFFGDFPRSYNSIMTPGFPNYFHLAGPGSPATHGGIFAIIQWQTRWVRKVLMKMQNEYIKAIEPKVEAAVDYYYHQHVMYKRLSFSQPCASWYKNGRVIGPVTSQYPGTRLHWHHLLKEPRYEDMNIEYLSGNRFHYLGNGYTKDDLEGKNLTWYFEHFET